MCFFHFHIYYMSIWEIWEIFFYFYHFSYTRLYGSHWFVTLPIYIFFKLDSIKFKSLPLVIAFILYTSTTCPYINKIIYNYAISIIFQIYCMAAILIWFALPTYSYTNCTYVCCNDFPLLFPSFWYTTCPYQKYNVYKYSNF